ncbi:hypothetical protein NRB_09860 [Novosphingobium sp. 11B]
MPGLRHACTKVAQICAIDESEQDHASPPFSGYFANAARLDILVRMRINLQRGLVVSLERGQTEIAKLDLSPFAQASAVQFVIIPNEQGLSLTII